MSNNQFALDIVVDGKVLPQFVHEGKSYVAAELGKNFSLRVSVPRFGRFEGVLSVDGLDVLTGDTAKTAAGGYVFTSATTPDDNDITGFRLNDKTVAKFIFVERGGSYAELTHRPANVGVIGPSFTKRWWSGSADRLLQAARSVALAVAVLAVAVLPAPSADTKGGHSAGTGFGEVADSRVTMTRFRRGPRGGALHPGVRHARAAD